MARHTIALASLAGVSIRPISRPPASLDLPAFAVSVELPARATRRGLFKLLGLAAKRVPKMFFPVLVYAVPPRLRYDQ